MSIVVLDDDENTKKLAEFQVDINSLWTKHHINPSEAAAMLTCTLVKLYLETIKKRDDAAFIKYISDVLKVYDETRIH